MNGDQNISSRLAARSGGLAAAMMLAAQIIWRLNWSRDGVVQAFPEFVVAAVARLTPLAVFGAATENYGSLAKKTLFVVVVIGIILVGRQGGLAAARISNQVGPGFRNRFVSGLIVALALFLVTNLVILPVAYLGIFASRSSYTTDILFQLIVTFALFAFAWATLATPTLEDAPMSTSSESTSSRRSLLVRGAVVATPIATAAVLGTASWKLLNPQPRAATPLPVVPADPGLPAAPAPSDAITVEDIVATQRANQGYDLEEPTPTAEESSFVNEPREVAQLQSDASPTSEDPFALFNQLQAQEDLSPVLTDTDDFYHVSKNLSDPTVESAGWQLTIDGMVNTPLTFTLDQLTERAVTRKITTLMCISNDLNGHLAGTAEWIGVPLVDILTEAGVQAGVVDLKLHAADDYEESFPLDRGLDPDTMIVIGMNGETLRDDHGYPARLIVPGIYGMKNVKWIDRIELIDNDFKGYWQTRGWSDPAPAQIWGRIDAPNGTIDAGDQYAAGMAAAGDQDISRVEVSIDGGDSWADAMIEPSLNPPFTWVRWAFPFTAESGKNFEIVMRVTDGQGKVMDEEKRSPLPDGATGWPSRKIKVR